LVTVHYFTDAPGGKRYIGATIRDPDVAA